MTERTVNEDHAFIVNYFNYLRRWDLEGVSDLNDFTRKFAPMTDDLITRELGDLSLNSPSPRYDNVNALLTSDVLYSNPTSYKPSVEATNIASGLQYHIKEKFNLDISTADIKTILYNEHVKDMNVLGVQWDQKSTVGKLMEMGVDQAAMAGYYLTKSPNIAVGATGLLKNLALPVMIFGGGQKLALTMGSKISQMVVGTDIGILGNFAATSAGLATSMKVVSLLDEISSDMAYGDAKKAIGLENSSSIDWDIIFASGGLVTISNGLRGFRKPAKPFKASSILSNTRRIFKSIFDSYKSE